MLASRSIALQGIGFARTPISMAVQGFLATLQVAQGWDTTQGAAGKGKTLPAPDMTGYWERINREAKKELARKHDEETAIIMACLQFVLEEA